VPLTLIPPVIAHSGATISIPEYSAIKETTDIPVAVRRETGRGARGLLLQRDGIALLSLWVPRSRTSACKCGELTLGEAPAVEVDAPDYVDVTLMAQPGRKLVHLINLPVGKPVNTGWRQIGSQPRACQRHHRQARAARAGAGARGQAASSETLLPVHAAGGIAEVVVPRLTDHEIVVFETV
jgi:hypothetical protein